MLLRRIEHLLTVRHILRKYTGQETQTLVGRLVPVGDCRTRLGSLCVLACLVRFAGILEYHVQRLKKRCLQLKMVADFGIDDNVSRHHVLVIQIVRHKLFCCLQVLDRFARHGDTVQNVEKSVRAHRLIAPRRRGLHWAFTGCELRTLEALCTNRLAGDGIRPALQKMIDLFLRVALAITGIRSGQVVDHLRAALKGSEVRDHGIPVMLRQGCGVIAAMLHENTRAHDLVDALFRSALTLYGYKVNLRQHIRQLILRVFAFGMEADAGHLYGSILLAVHETGKAHDPRLVHAHRIAVKVVYKLRLYHAETLHHGG